MDVRIGVTYSPREIELQMAEDTDRAELKARVEAVLGSDEGVLWIEDRKGREVGVAGRQDHLRGAGQRDRGSPHGLLELSVPAQRSALGLLDRRLLFVTGKGGVGKTSVASALGHLAASHGKRTLVCEVDSKGDLADFFGVGPLGFDPTEVRPNLFAMAMDTEESLKEYLRLQLKVPMLAKVGPLARTFDFIANAAPGVKEILTVGKLTYEVRERPLRPGGRRCLRHRPRRRPAGVARGDQRPGEGRAGAEPDRLDDRHPHRPRPDRGGRGDRAGGDAGVRDARAGRPTGRRDRHRGRLGGGQPGAARAVRPQRRGDLRPGARARCARGARRRTSATASPR